MLKRYEELDPGILIYLAIVALTGLAMGLSDAIYANYLKEVYAINAQQRGFIELPRELPGVLSILLIAALSRLGNIRMSMITQAFSIIALLVLGFFIPGYSLVLAVTFLFSFGYHMFMPLGDSIGLSLLKGKSVGLWFGKFNGVKTGFGMLAGIITFVGFKTGVFSFNTPISVFLAAAACFAAIIVLLIFLERLDKEPAPEKSLAPGFVWRKEYTRYYLICALFGGRKQIMIVFSPWVLIELLGFRADTMSILMVIGAGIGIFFIPMVGKWIDRFGVRNVMTAEAFAFIGVYILYGFLSAGLNSGRLTFVGPALFIIYFLYILDKMSAQFAMVRTMYMRTIAIVPSDITPSLSLGLCIDHVVSILGAFACGTVWYRFGPQYVFLIAGVLSLGNLILARGIKSALH
jgi:hypothetical protein